MDPATNILGIFALMSILWLIILGLVILTIVFWIIMLVDAVKREYPQENDKVVWILIIVLAGLIGAIIYYFVIKREDKNIRNKMK